MTKPRRDVAVPTTAVIDPRILRLNPPTSRLLN